MNGHRYQTMTDDFHANEVVQMMKDFYGELEVKVDTSQFPETIRYLLAHPDHGRIILMFDELDLAGFAIIIQHWSNEYGGTILYVDELYVIPECRNRGVGRQFFEHLARTKPFDAIAIALEVSPANERAQRFYESLGFTRRRNAILLRGLPKPPTVDAQ